MSEVIFVLHIGIRFYLFQDPSEYSSIRARHILVSMFDFLGQILNGWNRTCLWLVSHHVCTKLKLMLEIEPSFCSLWTSMLRGRPMNETYFSVTWLSEEKLTSCNRVTPSLSFGMKIWKANCKMEDAFYCFYIMVNFWSWPLYYAEICYLIFILYFLTQFDLSTL